MAPHPFEFQYPHTNKLIGALLLLSPTWVHILVIIAGLAILFAILKSIVHVALMNRHDKDVFASLTSRTVHRIIAARVDSSRNYEDAQSILYWFFGAYILALISLYFIGALIAFALLYWGTWEFAGWNQAFIAVPV